MNINWQPERKIVKFPKNKVHIFVTQYFIETNTHTATYFLRQPFSFCHYQYKFKCSDNYSNISHLHLNRT